MKTLSPLVFATCLGGLGAFAAVSSRAACAEETKKVQLNPQPEVPGAAVSTASPGVLKHGPAALTKVTPSGSPVLVGASVQFLVEGTGDCKRGRIDFGDGNTGNEYALVAGKGQPSPAHAYTKTGTYEVKVYGMADSWARVAAPPPASQHPCTGHATTEVVVKQTIVSVPPDVKK